VATANLKRFLSILIIDLIFAASAPIGIGIGIGVKSALEDDDYAYSIVDGTFQVRSHAAGSLHITAYTPLSVVLTMSV
jgi:hypothetical protein